jgi:hypothetical protein
MRVLRGELVEIRERVIMRAFEKLDIEKKGVVEVEDMIDAYNMD